MIQLDVGRSDDGLRAVVRLGRHRNDGLRRVLRFAFLRKRSVRASGIERRKIFGRSVVNYVGTIENRTIQHLGLCGQSCTDPHSATMNAT